MPYEKPPIANNWKACASRRQYAAGSPEFEKESLSISSNLYISALLLNYCEREKMFFTAQRGPEVTDLCDFTFQKLLRIVGKNNKLRTEQYMDIQRVDEFDNYQSLD